MKQTPEPDLALKRLYNNLFLLLGLGIVFLCGTLLFAILDNSLGFSSVATSAKPNPVPKVAAQGSGELPLSDDIVDGIHLSSGLKVAEGFEVVRAQCTACHSGKLVAQNRATRRGWEEMIRWMQETQGLWSLGDNEPVILNYLAANYGPEETGRRANLTEVEWYILDLEE